ncbi:7-carboxy-7-deazaguanine synthase QueE [Azotosporobacter soli]|uniref:7-carboxy-7-deazaguanine synthase QueE n=1 Tax=Azotosporobacter soli TaxID=3055040 RepID=UPI0031FEC47A
MANNTASLIEIFTSVQGEGKYAGCRQIFIRFAGCNLACAYCDTPDSRTLQTFAQVETMPGSRNFKPVMNPVTVDDFLQILTPLTAVPHHSLSFTGGEPLCHAPFIRAVGERLHSKRYLETNGTLVNELKEVLSVIDIISMDIKLPRHTGIDLWTQHAAFLSVAAKKDVYVKLVVDNALSRNELAEAVHCIASVDPAIPLYLQPVTPTVPQFIAPSPDAILRFQAQALEQLQDVRILPQTHKYLGQL